MRYKSVLRRKLRINKIRLKATFARHRRLKRINIRLRRKLGF